MRVTFVHLGRENMGIEYLSSILKQAGHTVSLAYDPGLFGINDNVLHLPRLERWFQRREGVLSDILKSDPHLVGFSVYTATYRWALEMAREVKALLGIPTVFGGIHPTLVPEEVIGREEVDYVVVGEAEEALLELMDRLEAGKRPRGVANVWYREGDRVIAHPPRAPIGELDRLPFPDKGLFEREVPHGDDYLIMASRGCPFGCTYCCESHLNRLYGGRFFRRRSVDSVLSELLHMKRRYGFREVMFNDPIFFTDRRWLEALLRRYRREIRVPFRCFGKVGFLDEEMVEWLRSSGCYAIEFGLQSINPTIRKEVLGRPESNEQAGETFRMLDRAGIRYDIDHMFGLPGETVQDHVEAARFYGGLRRLNRIKCHFLTYFPGLEIVERAKRSGMLTAADEVRIAKGEMSTDFFHVSAIEQGRAREDASDFQKLYKILPLIPRGWLEAILRAERWRGLRNVPGPLIIPGQIAVAVRGRDYRFVLYIKYYLWRLARSVQTVPKPRRLFAATLFGLSALGTIPVGNALGDRGAFHAMGILMGAIALWKAWSPSRKRGSG